MNDSDSTDITALREALHSKDRHQRAEAAVTLGSTGDQAVLADLQALLDDDDNLVATSATYGYWLLDGGPVNIDRAVHSLASTDEDEVQTAVQALGAMGDAVLPQLTAQLASDPPEAAEILQILGDIGGDEALQAVNAARHSDRPDIADSARDVLDEWED